MEPTKNYMARVIVQALYNSDVLPKVDNINVKSTARLKRVELENHYKLALVVLQQEKDRNSNLINKVKLQIAF